MLAAMEVKRLEMIEKLADVDDEVAEFYISEEEPPIVLLHAAIRRATIANLFTPVFMGSAFKNKGDAPTCRIRIHRRFIIQKGTRAHTHRELIREWLREPKDLFTPVFMGSAFKNKGEYVFTDGL